MTITVVYSSTLCFFTPYGCTCFFLSVHSRTVANLTRSLDWYTAVLGGVEVQDAGGDGWMGDSVKQLLMQHELLQGSPKANFTAELQDGGTDQLDARYVNFGPLQVELLDYHSKQGSEGVSRRHNDHHPIIIPCGMNCNTFTIPQLAILFLPRRPFYISPPPQVGSTLPHFGTETAPSVASNTHFAFRVRPETPLSEFVSLLEEASHARGFAEVKCNTLNAQPSDDARAAQVQADPSQNSYSVDDGPFLGWQLAYCKGPDGEQLEFTHEYASAGAAFGQALGMYVSGGDNPKWRLRRRVLRSRRV